MGFEKRSPGAVAVVAAPGSINVTIAVKAAVIGLCEAAEPPTAIKRHSFEGMGLAIDNRKTALATSVKPSTTDTFFV